MYLLGFIWLPWPCIYKVLFNSFEMVPIEYHNPHQSYDSSTWIADHGYTFLFFVFGCVVPGAVWLHFCCVLITNCIVCSCLSSHSGSWKSRLDTGKLDVYFLLNWLVLTWLHPVFRKGLALFCGPYFIKNSHLWEESFTACLWEKLCIDRRNVFLFRLSGHHYVERRSALIFSSVLKTAMNALRLGWQLQRSGGSHTANSELQMRTFQSKIPPKIHFYWILFSDLFFPDFEVPDFSPHVSFIPLYHRGWIHFPFVFLKFHVFVIIMCHYILYPMYNTRLVR